MPFVLDASVSLGWCFRDEQQRLTEVVSELLRNGETALVPVIWWFEIRHAALMGIRRQRVTSEQVVDFLSQVNDALIQMTSIPSEYAVLDLAHRHRLSFYDAAYLELAKRENIALATLDQALARAAAAEGVPLIGA